MRVKENVVDHLQHVHSRQLGRGPRAQRAVLSGEFEVPEQQQPQSAEPEEQGDTGVVRSVWLRYRCLPLVWRGGWPQPLP